MAAVFLVQGAITVRSLALKRCVRAFAFACWGVCVCVCAVACARLCACARACACVRACVCAWAWAPAVGMTHLGVLYPGMRACYIRLRSGWGSDGNVYNALRG